MSRSAEVTLAFAGEERTFRLPLGRMRALQEKVDAGPMELIQRLGSGAWRIDDVRETILQGLIGGGLEPGKATKLILSNFDDLPVQPFVPLALTVVSAAVVGAQDESLGEPEGERPTSLSPDPSSASAASTAPAPSSD